jgi:hypothetical protein
VIFISQEIDNNGGSFVLLLIANCSFDSNLEELGTGMIQLISLFLCAASTAKWPLKHSTIQNTK